MKTHKLLSTLLVAAFALAPQLLNTSHGLLLPREPRILPS
jgi:hypothetical protein